MSPEGNKGLEKRLDTLINLVQRLVVLELSRGGATQDEIAKHLHISKTTVNAMLKGTKKEK